MASLILQKEAAYLVHDKFTAETDDNEDHTFSGIMFDVVAKADSSRPVCAVVIDAVCVRGGLGRMTVWFSARGYRGKETNRSAWTLAYRNKVAPSRHEFAKLSLDAPLILQPGEKYGVYVHSAEDGDEGIVYDEERERITHDDDLITVLSGCAHLASEPFSDDGPWWGSPWRRRRCFVGQLCYGVRYMLWGPKCHDAFSSEFRLGASTAFGSLAMGWRGLPSDVVLYILNMCKFDWFGYSSQTSTRDLPSDQPTQAGSQRSQSQSQDRLTCLQRLRQRVSNDYSRFNNIVDSDGDDSDFEDD